MKRSVLPACLFLGVFASGASAADVSGKGSLNETFDANNNYFLSNAPSGYTARSSTALNLSVLAATPDTKYLLDSNVSYFKYFGPGAKDTPLTWGMPASEKFSIDHTTSSSKYNLAASWSRVDVASTNLAQTGIASGHGTSDNYALDGGWTHDITRSDSIVFSPHASTVSYSDQSQTTYADLSATTSWNHKLSPTTTLIQSLYFDSTFFDDVAKTQRLFWKATTGLETQLTKLLSFHGSIGMTFVNAYQNGTAMPPSGTGFQPMVGAANGWVGNMVLTYQLFSDTRIGLTATRAIIPTIYGQLQQIESIGSTLNYDINHSSSMGFSAQFSHTNLGNSGTTTATMSDFFTASANYSYKLTREWRTNLSYTYRQNLTQGVRSNAILFSLTRDFTLFGKPPEPAQKTPSELAQQDLARAQQALPNLIP